MMLYNAETIHVQFVHMYCFTVDLQILSTYGDIHVYSI